MPRLLIAFDGSEAARAAVRAVGGLFPRQEAIVLAAYDTPPGLGRALVAGATPNAVAVRSIEALGREAPDRAMATAEEGSALAAQSGLAAEPEIVVTQGGVWPEVLATAAAREAEIIACGTRGRGSLGRALLGSTASSILHHAHCSVLIVPNTDLAPAGPVLIAYDGSEGARAAIATTGRLFPGRAATVVHAWRPMLRDSWSGRALLAAPIEDLQGVAQDLEDGRSARSARRGASSCRRARTRCTRRARHGGERSLARAHPRGRRSRRIDPGGRLTRSRRHRLSALGLRILSARAKRRAAHPGGPANGLRSARSGPLPTRRPEEQGGVTSAAQSSLQAATRR